jgi:hypothetical protein
LYFFRKNQNFSLNLPHNLIDMHEQLSFTDLVNGAARLDFQDYERFVVTVNKLRVQQKVKGLPQKELDLLAKINRGFPVENWLRIQHLDAKIEEDALSEQEYAELTLLTDKYEKYSVQRIRLLKKLALLRNISVEEAINQLDLPNG